MNLRTASWSSIVSFFEVEVRIEAMEMVKYQCCVDAL
jgi:hypothetical protein